ncbi:response regulator [bacterium]|nr:response regulator [bacterium]
MKNTFKKILWADDEIDHLKPHILFLEDKGYHITSVTNAEDAIASLKIESYDLVLLDEMMTGMDGLQALPHIQEIQPGLPVIMITKSEQEDLMEEALSENVRDYLTKPVNPSQILSSVKRILERKRITRDKLTRDYTAEFGSIMSIIDGNPTVEEWMALHLRLCQRELALDRYGDQALLQTLTDQREECNRAFCRFVSNNYSNWVNTTHRPLMSVDLFKKYVFPHLNSGTPVWVIVIDNLRLDQWLDLEPLLYDYFNIKRDTYLSILPTATPYSRNALFSGLWPSEIAKYYPKIWSQGEDDDSSRNRHEATLLDDYLKREGVDFGKSAKYVKILDSYDNKQLLSQAESYLRHPFSAMVFNFVDIMSHRRSESKILQEIVPDESAYRRLTRSWFEHSALFEIMKKGSQNNVRIIVTSDHGSIRVKHEILVHADRATSTNLRYKYGRSIKADSKQVFTINNPLECGLPSSKMNTNYLISHTDNFFVYPNHFHKYVNLYKDSLQHGGISMEEMILPVVELGPLRGGGHG